MRSVSAHGGLVCVYLSVNGLTTEGITTLVRNSPKLIKICVKARHLYDMNGQRLNQRDVQDFSATLKKMFSNRKLFNVGYCLINERLCQPPDDLLPLWN